MKSLQRAGLFEEVKDRLEEPGTGLSGGQQQRLCIARAIAVNPEVILMDEPCSALDPIATARVEELIDELRQNYTIVIVTHSMQQAARVSQRTAMFHLGYLVEEGPTDHDVHQSARAEDAGLHHRPLRLRGPQTWHQHIVTSFEDDLQGLARSIAEMGGRAEQHRRALHHRAACAPIPTSRTRSSRPTRRSTSCTGRSRSGHPGDRPAPADGAGPARDDRGDPHRQRSRARRRPRQEHRQARPRHPEPEHSRRTCASASSIWRSLGCGR